MVWAQCVIAAGILFMIAATMLACAFNISQIFIGRVFQGIAVRPYQVCADWATAAHCPVQQPAPVESDTQSVWAAPMQISFASVSVPIYNSEMAPPQHRGRLNQLYQLVLTAFIFIAQLINLIVHGAPAPTAASHYGCASRSESLAALP